MLIEIIIVFVAQLLFQFFRSLSTRTVSKEKVGTSMVLTGIIQSLWLLTTAMGVNAMLNYDIPIIISYIVGGIVGCMFNFYIRVGDA